MSSEAVTLSRDTRGIATLSLNRPEVHNAFDDAMIASLVAHLEAVAADPEVRVLIVRSEGKNFSAGADINWMRRMAELDREGNLKDARGLARLMETLDNLPQPTLARVQGAAFGGAVGLAACCDLVVASRASRFCLSEVRIGLIPAVISPYVVRALGERQARRYCLSAEVFSAEAAAGWGLVHELVEDDQALDARCESLVTALLSNGPQAVREAKRLVRAVSGRVIDAEVRELSAQWIADVRVSDEGQEGLSAFLQKRKPAWIRE